MNPEKFSTSNPESMTEKQAELSKRREEWVNKLAERGLSPETFSVSFERRKVGKSSNFILSGTVNGHVVEAIFNPIDSKENFTFPCEKFVYDGNSVTNPVASSRLVRDLWGLQPPEFSSLENEANEEIKTFNAKVENDSRVAAEEIERVERASQEKKESEAIISEIEKMFFPNA